MEPSELPIGLRHRILEYVSINECNTTEESEIVRGNINSSHKIADNATSGKPTTLDCSEEISDVGDDVYSLKTPEKYALESPGFFIRDSFLSDVNSLTLSAALRDILLQAQEQEGKDGIQLTPAKFGQTFKTTNAEIRGDKTAWISKYWHENTNSSSGAVFGHLFKRMKRMLSDAVLEDLGIINNRTSIQVALYPGNGEGYSEHRDTNVVTSEDSCTGRPVRKYTCIYYLNPRWKKEYGGELQIEGKHLIAPIGNRLVVFKSHLRHAVLACHAPRYAITFWFYGTHNSLAAPGRSLRIKDEKMKSIFVAIPSYRDPQLQYTVLDAFTKAENADRIFIGVYWQCKIAEDARTCFNVELPEKYANKVRICMVDSKYAKGPTYARHVVHQLYRNEDFVLNIDSHTRFRQNWDTLLINMLHAAQQTRDSEKVILTTYPAGYEFNPDDPAKVFIPNEQFLQYAGPLELKPAKFGEDGMLRIKACRLNHIPEKPTLARFWAAGFNFSSSEVLKVQYPPLEHLFFGEESLMAARLWTHGWDFYTPNEDVIYHCWSRSYRETQKSPSDDRLKALKWVHQLFDHKNDDEFGLGTSRSLEEYETFCGVKFSEKSIQ